jgi:hypothetical protein
VKAEWRKAQDRENLCAIRNLEHNVGDLMGYIMTDGPGG